MLPAPGGSVLPAPGGSVLCTGWVGAVHRVGRCSQHRWAGGSLADGQIRGLTSSVNLLLYVYGAGETPNQPPGG